MVHTKKIMFSCSRWSREVSCRKVQVGHRSVSLMLCSACRTTSNKEMQFTACTAQHSGPMQIS